MKNLKRILSALFCVLLVLTVLHVFESASGTPWDGKTIDVSWYESGKGVEIIVVVPTHTGGQLVKGHILA